MLLKNMGKELGISEAAIIGSDPNKTAIRKYASNLYDNLKSGNITSQEAIEQLHVLGFGRATATLLNGSKGDFVSLGIASGIEYFKDLIPDKKGWEENMEILKRDSFNPTKGKNIIKNENAVFENDPHLASDPRYQKVDNHNKAELKLKMDFVPDWQKSQKP
jgi:hypothetical protein